MKKIAVLRTGYVGLTAARAEEVLPAHSQLRYCQNPYEAARGSAAVFIATDWKEFQDLDWNRMGSLMQGKTILDGRA
jgi:UDPglucose 6-dehydrogenase